MYIPGPVYTAPIFSGIGPRLYLKKSYTYIVVELYFDFCFSALYSLYRFAAAVKRVPNATIKLVTFSKFPIIICF